MGKTYIVREFAKGNYDHFIEINFLSNKTAKEVLSQAVDAKDLFSRISILADSKMVPGKTLIFIDEVQENKEFVTAIKFLVDQFDYDFILSGSLLGVELQDIESVPVGYLDSIEMSPLDFEEFCWAHHIDDNILQTLKSLLVKRKPIPGYLHEKMMKLFHDYLIVGGMPAAVDRYLQTANLQDVRAVQQNIIKRHREDIAKYNSGSALEIKRIYDLIPSELSNQSKRFRFNSLDKDARYDRYKNNFLWLENAGVALPCNRTSSPTFPLLLNKEANYFKLFSMDVGLLTSMLMRDATFEIMLRDNSINYGAIYENAVAQALHAQSRDLYYFSNKKMGELDFVVESSVGCVYPIEVKSGKSYKRHNALSNVLNTKNYNLPFGYVFCSENVSVSNQVIYLPIYLVNFFDSEMTLRE
ncbi:MAG: AAA family ATPase [Coriobacteriia bacterium]|nr:AAA family ATPase [Coriobacteriia bacterium]